MGIFITEVGLEIRNNKIVGGYTSVGDGITMEEAVSRYDTVFKNSIWEVNVDAPIKETASKAAARIQVSGGENYRRGIRETSGWLLLGTRDGCSASKFVTNRKFESLDWVDHIEDTIPDGEFDFEFDVTDNHYTVLISDGSVAAERYETQGPQPRIHYSVEDATWTAYVSSCGQNGGREATIITELNGNEVEYRIDDYLLGIEVTDLMDLLEIWEEIVGLSE